MSDGLATREVKSGKGKNWKTLRQNWTNEGIAGVAVEIFYAGTDKKTTIKM